MKLSSSAAVLRVDAQLIADVLPFAATMDIRYYLCGVCIRPTAKGGVLVIATDGHAIYCVRDPNGKAPGDVILPLRKSLHARHLKPGHALYMDGDNRIWVTDRNGLPIWISPTGPIHGKFPKADTLVGPLDRYAEGLSGTVQTALLNRMLDAGHARQLRVYTEQREDKVPGKVLFVSGADGFGILMPMADARRLDAVIPPEFMPAPADAEVPHAS